MPPRHTKSEFASIYFPAWMIGKNPKMKLMQVSHNAELSARFGAKVRNLIDSPEYKQIFGDVKLREDSKAKGRWETNHGGEYFAAGLAVLLLDEGRTYLLSMILILNKTHYPIVRWRGPMIGIYLDQDSVYNQEAQLFL